MAHRSMETETWARTPAYNDVGAAVNNRMSVEDIIANAKLNWSVSLREMQFKGEDGRMHKYAGKHVLARDSDDQPLTMCGARFKPVQNAEAVEFFKLFSERGGGHLVAAGSIRKGRLVWGLADLGHEFKLPGGDSVKGQLLLAASHECGRATIGKILTFRFACSNQLGAILSGKRAAAMTQSFSHVREFKAEEAVATFIEARETLSEFEKNAQTLMKLNLSWEDAVRVLAPVYQPQADVADLLADPNNWCPSIRSIMDCYARAPGAVEGNAWGLLNGVTYHANHRANASAEARLVSNWLGTEAKRSVQVAQGLLEMAS